MTKTPIKTELIELIQFLKNVTYLQTLPDDTIHTLADQCECTHIKSGEFLIKQGDIGDCLYIVQSGRLIATKNTELGEEEVGHMNRGELIGELSLFTQAPRSATVMAIRDSILWKLPKASFDTFVQQNPIYIMPMVKAAILRLLNPPIRKKGTNYALTIMQAGRYAIDQSFLQSFVKELSQVGRILHLNSNTLRTHFKEMNWASSTPESFSHSKITEWLNIQEQTYKYIIYEVDQSDLSWTQLCLRQADKILLLGDSRDSAELGETEKLVFQKSTYLAPVELILLHSPTVTLPTNTSSWLKDRHVVVHHIKKDNDSDIKRAVRIISGRSISLVLGGGGAKGLAHIGVYKALCELGIPVDTLGGTSMGSIIAATIAMNDSHETMTEKIERLIVNNKKFKDYTIPTVAVFSGRGWLNALKNCYGEDVCIEDLWRNFFCVASNFTLRKMDVLQSGLVYKAVRASVSLPGVVPPISNEKDELLIDGGIFNNLPVDVMRSIAPSSKIIAVRVSPLSDIHLRIPDGIVEGIKRFFARHSSPSNKYTLPGLPDMIAGAITLCNDEKEATMLNEADFALDLPLKEYGLFDFEKLHQLIEMGYRDTMEKLTKNPINFNND